MLGLLDLLRAVKGSATLAVRRMHPVVGGVLVAVVWMGALGAMFTLTGDDPAPPTQGSHDHHEPAGSVRSTTTSDDDDGDGDGEDGGGPGGGWAQRSEWTPADGSTTTTTTAAADPAGDLGDLGAPSAGAPTRPSTPRTDPEWVTSSTTTSTTSRATSTTTTTTPPSSGGLLGGLVDLLGLGKR